MLETPASHHDLALPAYTGLRVRQAGPVCAALNPRIRPDPARLLPNPGTRGNPVMVPVRACVRTRRFFAVRRVRSRALPRVGLVDRVTRSCADAPRRSHCHRRCSSRRRKRGHGDGGAVTVRCCTLDDAGLSGMDRARARNRCARRGVDEGRHAALETRRVHLAQVQRTFFALRTGRAPAHGGRVRCCGPVRCRDTVPTCSGDDWRAHTPEGAAAASASSGRTLRWKRLRPGLQSSPFRLWSAFAVRRCPSAPRRRPARPRRCAQR